MHGAKRGKIRSDCSSLMRTVKAADYLSLYRHPSDANTLEVVPGLGDHLRRSVPDPGPWATEGLLCGPERTGGSDTEEISTVQDGGHAPAPCLNHKATPAQTGAPQTRWKHVRPSHIELAMGYFDSVYAADLPHRAVTVYMYLKDRTNQDGICWPSIKTIARELKLSRATVCRALDDLCQAGFLIKDERWRENGGRSSNLYRIP